MSTSTFTYQPPETIGRDVEQLRSMTEQFRAGEISASRYQAFRVPQGVYEQRESGTYMLRARLASGILTPAQMRVAAEVAEGWGNGTLHLTSRQDLQVHGVPVEGIAEAVARLTGAGLATKGGGGNTVRNIAGCYQAGACPDEVFDITPDVIALTEGLLPDPLSFQLPRKYKIACSGCAGDCAGAQVNDLGFVAKTQDGVAGFAVYVGGGMGADSRVGRLLEPFVPVGEALRVAESIKHVFDQHGNRRNRNRARLRFLVDDLGLEKFRELYQTQKAKLAADSGRTVTAPVSQEGFEAVEVAPRLGVIEAGTLRELADVVERFGEGVLRATPWQTAVLRRVPSRDVAALVTELERLGVAADEPRLLRHMVSCAGASTCRLGICRSRGVVTAIREALVASGLDLSGAAGALTLHVSGCPNSCGRHPVASIGLYGAARRVNGRLAPYYIVQLGGRVDASGAVLASGTTAVPARRVPGFVVEFVRAFAAAGVTYEEFLAGGGRAVCSELAGKQAPGAELEEEFYQDWEGGEAFSLAGRGQAECGAGVFDLIDIDLAASEAALQGGRLFASVAASARALLVTRGEEADSDADALARFYRVFVKEKLVSDEAASLIERASRVAGTEEPEAGFEATAAEAGGLLASVRGLYAG